MITGGLRKIVSVVCLFQKQNQLIVKHLLIPKQHGTADFCEMENEEEIGAFIVQNDPIQLGWIHVSLCELGYSIYSSRKYNVMARVGLEH